MNTILQKQILQRIFWDYNYEIEELENTLLNPQFSELKQSIYLKLLLSCNWYTLQEILTPVQLKEALQSKILNKIHIKTLKAKYEYAARVLFE